MTFLSLNDTAKAYILALCIISFVLLLIALVAYMVEKYKRSRIVVILFMLAYSIVNFSALLQLNKIGRAMYNVSLTREIALFNSIPYFFHIAINLVFVGFALFSIYSLYKSSKNKINTFSIKEALENLPTGIAFKTKHSDLLLANHIMHNLCKEITGKALQNAKTFWDDINAIQSKENCVIKSNEPAFVLKNGDIWQFSKTMHIYSGDEYCEYKATNITQLYNLSEDMRNVGEKLMQQHQRLKKLTDIIEDNAEIGVALNMKINFHDNFGNLLALTKKAIIEGENIDEAKTLVDYWKNLNSTIKELSSNDKQSLTLEQVMLFANKLGCEILIKGEMPRDEHNKIITLLCINEMLKNAYMHAGAQKLSVNILQSEGAINFTIQNNVTHELYEIKEGGGLSSLRQRIEKAGGAMTMSCNDGVTMSVKLLKVLI